METNKYFDDDFLTNKLYSKIGGIEINELMQLEIDYLNTIKWKMVIEENRFIEYSKKLQSIFLGK
jgi:hypothetical protein